MKFLVTIVNGLKPLIIVTKGSILDVAGFLDTPLKVVILFMHQNIVTHLWLYFDDVCIKFKQSQVSFV